MKLQFRNAQVDDIPVIFSQAKALIDAYEDTSSIDYDKVLRWMESKITRHIHEYTCAIFNGQKCAFWRLCEDGELDDFYVLPSFQGMGIGTRIMEKCINDSVNTIWLYVFSRNFRARSFYERFGFSVREKIGLTRMIMQRTVDTTDPKIYNCKR